MSLITLSWNDLIVELKRFADAGLVELEAPAALRVGTGTQTKHVTGYVLDNKGLTLIISGNEKAGATSKPAKAAMVKPPKEVLA